LSTASSGFGFPLTVQDSVFRRSIEIGLSGLYVLFFLMLAVMFVALLAVRSYFEDRESLALLLFFAVPMAVCLPFYLRHSVIDLKADNARKKVLQLIQKIERKRGWHTDGIFLIRCGRSFWREVIELCVTSAAVVVIDVTELSENVIWELQTALRLVGPGSIVLAYGVEAGAAKELPGQRREELTSGTDGEWFGLAKVFLYPRTKQQLRDELWGSQTRLVQELRQKLAEGIANTEYRHALEEADLPPLTYANVPMVLKAEQE
jgi:hypothetical protein